MTTETTEQMYEATNGDGIIVYVIADNTDTHADMEQAATDQAWADGHRMVSDQWTFSPVTAW